MTRFALAASLVLLAAAANPAAAQTITIQPSPQNRTPSVPVQRVETQFNIILPGAPASDSEEIKRRTEAAHRIIFELAASECALLSDIFKAECRLVSVRAGSTLGLRGGGGEGTNANGSASYELSPKS